jgi:hypothetical protein
LEIALYHQRFKSVDVRFDEKYSIEPDGCWRWKNAGDGHYPSFWCDSGRVLASHFMWRRLHGAYPETGLEVCHTCDNPPCVNPKHLFLGTHSDNMKDRSAKGRLPSRKGALNPRAKLTPEAVAEIRERYALGDISQARLGIELGVGQSTVSSLLRGETWA